MDRLSEIRARCEAATPGPWEADYNRPFSEDLVGIYAEGKGYILLAEDGVADEDVPLPEDAAFISHAREDIPFLLAEVERLNKFADAYAPSARTIALYLAKFCDRSLPYAEMIADAARKADSEITALAARAEKAEAAQKALVDGYDYYADRSQKWENAAKEWAARAEKAEAERDVAYERGFDAGQNNMLEAGYVLEGE